MSLSLLPYLLELMNHSPREILRKYPVFSFGFILFVVTLATQLITWSEFPGAYYIGMASIIIMIYGLIFRDAQK